jgi:small acid-soluble spore protein B (major beta-type SASP)
MVKLLLTTQQVLLKITLRRKFTMSNTNNRTVVPEAKAALNQMKLEIANEIGLANYENIDKGNLTARQNGYVGGYMTKKLVEMAEQQIAGK